MIAAAVLLAADKPLNEDTVRPGLLGLLFFVGLFVATYFLWRSMNKQLKKVDAHFAEVDEAEAAETAGADDAGATDAATDAVDDATDEAPTTTRPEERPPV